MKELGRFLAKEGTLFLAFFNMCTAAPEEELTVRHRAVEYSMHI